MKCPICKNEMISGDFVIRPTILGFLFFGFSYKHLYFYNNNEAIRVLDNGENKNGWYCKKCKSFVVDKRDVFIEDENTKTKKDKTYNIETREILEDEDEDKDKIVI